MSTIISGIREYLEGYEGLSGGEMHVDWLPETARAYSIFSEPGDTILNTYMDGSIRRQFTFTLASAEYYGPDIPTQVQNMDWYEAFSAWVEKQNIKRSFPDIGDGKKVKTFEILSAAYPVTLSDDGIAQYQMQLRITYLQEGYL